FVKTAKTANDFSIKLKNGKASHTAVTDFNPFLEEFRQSLIELLNEIYNKEVAFSQTPHVEKCKTCPFVAICGRN
ncbi:MAG TPA: PD-(D/E)XK nuclease family protein, partial [Tenuifilaceae bacterium]|nr:PD-(D/E)XK nuclease family protein [Tenuifilaceae bacterium]